MSESSYKMAVVTFKVQSTTTPAYLSRHLQPRNCVRNLWSSDTPLLCQPFTKTDLTGRGFRYSPPAVWNSLPRTVLDSRSITVFRSRLKTHFFDLAHITVWTVVQTVLTATFNSYGDRQISTPYKINTPEPIDKKFGTVDYVREGAFYTKFCTIPPTENFWANGWNITKNYFYLYLFFSQAHAQVRPVDGFLHAIAQKTWNYAMMCLLGSEWCAPKFWGKTPQKLKFWGRE